VGLGDALARLKLRLQLGFWPPPLDGMQTFSRMRFLHDCVLDLAPAAGAALEVGCFKGGSTVYLGMACRRRGIAPVAAIDLFTGTPGWNQSFDTHDEARARLDRWGLADVRLIRGDSRVVAWDMPLAVLHIDGDHSFEACSADLARFAPHLVPGGIVILDDYDDVHPGVTRAAREFLARGGFEIARDNYRAGGNGSICLRRVQAR
jgi:predicted O-methyltransferase YrrM